MTIFAENFEPKTNSVMKPNEFFTPSWEYLKAKHSYFNNRFFNGELKWCNLRTSVTEHFGDFCYKDGYPQIRISIKYVRTEEAYLNTLLHEMIHQYMFQFGITEETRGYHGREFKKIAGEINSQGYNTEDKSFICLNPNVKQKATKNEFIICCYLQRDGTYFTFRIAESKINYYMNWFEDRADFFRNPIIVRTANTKFAHLTANRRHVRRGYTFTQEQVSKELANPIEVIYRAVTLSCHGKLPTKNNKVTTV